MRAIKRFLGVPNLRRSSPFYIFMHFLPGISLLTLWRFVAEVRWLFPVSRQKKRESGKQRNTEPWRWELNENTTQRLLKSVLRAHHFIENILSKSSVPVYCLFVFACFFFLLWQFVGSSYSLFISPLQDTETGSKAEHSKNKWQNINCYKSNKVLCMLSRFCFYNCTPCLSSLVRQK